MFDEAFENDNQSFDGGSGESRSWPPKQVYHEPEEELEKKKKANLEVKKEKIRQKYFELVDKTHNSLFSGPESFVSDVDEYIITRQRRVEAEAENNDSNFSFAPSPFAESEDTESEDDPFALFNEEQQQSSEEAIDGDNDYDFNLPSELKFKDGDQEESPEKVADLVEETSIVEEDAFSFEQDNLFSVDTPTEVIIDSMETLPLQNEPTDEEHSVFTESNRDEEEKTFDSHLVNDSEEKSEFTFVGFEDNNSQSVPVPESVVQTSQESYNFNDDTKDQGLSLLYSSPIGTMEEEPVSTEGSLGDVFATNDTFAIPEENAFEANLEEDTTQTKVLYSGEPKRAVQLDEDSELKSQSKLSPLVIILLILLFLFGAYQAWNSVTNRYSYSSKRSRDRRGAKNRGSSRQRSTSREVIPVWEVVDTEPDSDKKEMEFIKVSIDGAGRENPFVYPEKIAKLIADRDAALRKNVLNKVDQFRYKAYRATLRGVLQAGEEILAIIALKEASFTIRDGISRDKVLKAAVQSMNRAEQSTLEMNEGGFIGAWQVVKIHLPTAASPEDPYVIVSKLNEKLRLTLGKGQELGIYDEAGNYDDLSRFPL